MHNVPSVGMFCLNIDLLGWSIAAYGLYNPFNESIFRTPPTHPSILSQTVE